MDRLVKYRYSCCQYRLGTAAVYPRSKDAGWQILECSFRSRNSSWQILECSFRSRDSGWQILECSFRPKDAG